MTVSEAIAVSVNTSLRTLITGDEIVHIFHEGVIPPAWMPHFHILFSDISATRLETFFSAYSITLQKIEKIYALIPPLFHNEAFDGLLRSLKNVE